MKCKKNYAIRHFLQKICFAFLLLFSSTTFAQNIQISGTVTDRLGEPVVGASVAIKGTTTGSMTDIDGKYSISAGNNATLVFSFIGMKPQEVVVAGKTTINVTLEETAQNLDEVIVIGYGSIRKGDLTTAVSSVSSKDWADRPIISAQQALQGKAAGVQIVQPSGKPGVGMSIRVRGTTSLNAGNDPLYVVDGIPTNDINNISPNDIESMQILKDASSAAIYGARAANGVVLITTKKGTQGKSQINLSMYTGFSNVAKTIKTLNTEQYYDLIDDINKISNVGNIDRTNNKYIDWAKEMYGTGIQQNYQVSFSGSSDKVNYYLSGGYQNETGIISPAEYDRFSFRSNLSSQIKSWLTVSSNTSFTKVSRRDVADNSNVDRGGVIMSILNTPPNISIWKEDKPNEYQPNPLQASWENPVAQADSYNKNDDYRFMGNICLDFSIIKELHFKPSFSVDYTSHTWNNFIDPIKTNYGRTGNGRGEQAKDTYLTWLSENIMSYNKKIGEKHNLGLMGGATLQRYIQDKSYISAQDFVKGTNFDVMTLNMANKINSARTTKEANSLLSFLFRTQYDYESRYLFTANMRIDGSSKLDPDHRWGYFPSVSAGWRFSSESFFEPLTTVINDAKLRIAWGRNGNQNGIGNYDYYGKYDISQHDTTDGESLSGPNITPGRYGNKDLKWETTAQYNMGLDFSFFNSRLTAEFDAYYKKTTDLLLYITLPSSVGRNLPMRNDGEMINKGFEFNINGKILTGDLKWDASMNMSFNKNELSKLGLTPQYTTARFEGKDDIIMMRAGYPLGSFFGYISDGVDPDTGDIIYRDLDGNGEITSNDRTFLGNAQPDFTFGFTNNFSWKNITLSTFFQGSYGNDIFNASRIDLEGMYTVKNQSETVINRWLRPGMITDVPRAGNSDNSRISSRFVEDGSYIRLKTLTLSYNFDKKIIKNMGVEGLSIYATANNLFTLSKYRGYDPELSWLGDSAAQLGIDWGTYPQTRSFIFGLNLTF